MALHIVLKIFKKFCCIASGEQCVMYNVENDQTYIKNLAAFTSKDFFNIMHEMD